ncbi:MAG: hypothetical protein DBX93_04760 [Oscillospiraceae bacterium]|nr:MAG: hypothetical protein DBX93_04760 [Oscillospiraceae bacterium]
MKNILLGIFALFLAVLAVAAIAYSDPLYQIEESMRKYNDGKIVSESLAGYIPPETLETPEVTTEATSAEPEEPYYAAAAARMAERGIFPAGDAFNPNAAITRSRFTQVICAILGLEDEAKGMKGKTDYVDVPENYWASGYINCATAHGLIGGVGDGFFGPEDVVLYEQGIKVAMVCIGETVQFDPDTTNWVAAYITRAEEIGLTDDLAGAPGELLHCDDFAVLADRIVEILAERAADEAAAAATAAVPQTTTTSAPKA